MILMMIMTACLAIHTTNCAMENPPPPYAIASVHVAHNNGSYRQLNIPLTRGEASGFVAALRTQQLPQGHPLLEYTTNPATKIFITIRLATEDEHEDPLLRENYANRSAMIQNIFTERERKHNPPPAQPAQQIPERQQALERRRCSCCSRLCAALGIGVNVNE